MKLLVLYVDAWPYPYKDIIVNTVRSVDRCVRVSRLIPVYGYTDCFKVSMLTGVHPDEHGYWVSYKFSETPRKRPIPRALSLFLDRDALPIRGARFVLNRFMNNHMFHVRTWSYIRELEINPESSFYDIDKYLRRKGFKTLFSSLDEHGLSYIVVEDRFYRHNLEVVTKLVGRYGNTYDIVFVYIDEPDFWGHRYGVDSSRYIELLRLLSRIVLQMIRVAKYNDASYIVFSDHGMSPVNRILDIYSYVLRDEDYGRKYLLGIDATFLRIFYLNDYVETPYLERIKGIIEECSKKLTYNDIKEYRLPNDRYYGDEVYALSEGCVLFPNFFSWLRPQGMHAYSPESTWQHGIVLASEDIELKDFLNPADLRTLIERAGVDK